jgi:hypothetical protein
MPNICEQKLYPINYNQPIRVNIAAAYAPLAGVKGGLFFCLASKTANGNYRAQLKNIFYSSKGPLTLIDGSTTFDYANLFKFYQCQLNYVGVPAAAALTTYYAALYTPASSTLSLLAFNNTGTLVEPTTSLRVEHSLTFTKYKVG